MKMFWKELDALSEDSEKFEPKLKVLMEDVEHHVEEKKARCFARQKQFNEALCARSAPELSGKKKLQQVEVCDRGRKLLRFIL